jgi:hypothetical protein
MMTWSEEERRHLPVGTKHDSDKPRFSLVPRLALSAVVGVLEYGAKKYAPENWREVPDARTRYFDAAHRHLGAWWAGETHDPESKQHHLGHALCCLLFLLELELESK